MCFWRVLVSLFGILPLSLRPARIARQCPVPRGGQGKRAGDGGLLKESKGWANLLSRVVSRNWYPIFWWFLKSSPKEHHNCLDPLKEGTPICAWSKLLLPLQRSNCSPLMLVGRVSTEGTAFGSCSSGRQREYLKISSNFDKHPNGKAAAPG